MNQYMLEAVKNRLNASIVSGILGGNSAGCDLCDAGRPTIPFQGLVFFGIHGGQVVSNNRVGGYYSDERYDFNVTVTMKAARVPRYKIGTVTLSTTESGLFYLLDLVKAALHGYLPLSEEASLLLLQDYPGGQEFLFGEPPLFQGSDIPVERSGDWFNAKQDSQGAMMGMSSTSRFNGLRMIRSIPTLQTQVV